VPIGVTVAGANTHDKHLVEETLESIPVEPPDPERVEQHLCLDKGYDYADVRALVAAWGYVGHIKSRGEEQRARSIPGFRARRWVCERTHSWMNRFRRLLIRWEKKPDNYLAMIHFACAYITWNAAGVLG
jgi:putative transposase